MITDLVKFFNVGKTMNDQQVAQTIELILGDENLKSLKPDDFKLCFNWIKKGQYGKAYDRIDGQIILECLYLYLHDRVAEAEQISFNKHQIEKDGKMSKSDPEGQKKVLDILKSALKDGKPAQKVKTDRIEFDGKKYTVFTSTVIEGKKDPVYIPEPKKEKSDRDKFIENCFREFHKLWLTDPIKEESGKATRFVKIEGKEMDEVEYTEMKLKEFDSQSHLSL